MGIVVIGAVFVDIKGYPLSTYIPGGRNAGRIEQVHGGVSRNVVEDIANVLGVAYIGYGNIGDLCGRTGRPMLPRWMATAR